MAVQIAQKINTLIDRYGSTVTIKDRTVASYDQYGNPVWSYPSLGSEKAFLDIKETDQRLLPSGELQDEEVTGFFRSDSQVSEGRRATFNSVDYQVLAVKKVFFGDILSHLEAKLKRVT